MYSVDGEAKALIKLVEAIEGSDTGELSQKKALEFMEGSNPRRRAMLAKFAKAKKIVEHKPEKRGVPYKYSLPLEKGAIVKALPTTKKGK